MFHVAGYPAVYLAEARRLGLRVQPPHVNHSDRRFTLDTTTAPWTLWLGLSWVRDVRRASVRAIVAARPYTDLPDLLRRVPLHKKEVQHLIQSGALDDLGDSRAALLTAAERSHAWLGQLRMAFGLRPTVIPDTPAQRLAWERHLLGFPVGVHPLTCVQLSPDTFPLRDLPAHANHAVTVAGIRLPSWDAGGFLLDDGDCYVRAVFPRSQKEKPKPPTWQPVVVRGQWRGDRFGNLALVVEDWQALG